MPKKGRSSLEDRLHRIEGQIRGIEGMLEQEQDMQRVIPQIQAVISGLEGVKLEIIREHIQEKMTGEMVKVLDMLR